MTNDKDADKARIAELEAVLRELMASFEAHVYLRDKKPRDQWDEYDFMMGPLWEAAERALLTTPRTSTRSTHDIHTQ